MKYKIVTDSACDLTKEEAARMDIEYVPFKIDVDEVTFEDNEELDLQAYLEAMEKSPNPIRTACPSPFEFERALETGLEHEGIFVVTITGELSGSYNSAVVAVENFREKYPDVPVCLIDSRTASAGQTAVVYKLESLINEGLSFEEIDRKIHHYVEEMQTYILLESLDNLVKNGRIKKTAGFVMGALNVKPILREENGEIVLHQINRGFKKGLKKIADYVSSLPIPFEEYELTITYVNALEKAEMLRDFILKKCAFAKTRIIPCKGLNSGYADIGGIVLAF